MVVHDQRETRQKSKQSYNEVFLQLQDGIGVEFTDCPSHEQYLDTNIAQSMFFTVK